MLLGFFSAFDAIEPIVFDVFSFLIEILHAHYVQHSYSLTAIVDANRFNLFSMAGIQQPDAHMLLFKGCINAPLIYYAY